LNAVMPLTALFSQRWMGRLIDRRGCDISVPFSSLWAMLSSK
jgi:hypothetical protein